LWGDSEVVKRIRL